MTPFSWLLMGHLIGDFLFQTNWMASRKAKEWLPLLVHSITYTVIVSLFGFWTHSISYLGMLVIFVSHVFLDRRHFILFWVRRIQGAKGGQEAWLSIMTDQIFHLIILVIVLYI